MNKTALAKYLGIEIEDLIDTDEYYSFYYGHTKYYVFDDYAGEIDDFVQEIYETKTKEAEEELESLRKSSIYGRYFYLDDDLLDQDICEYIENWANIEKVDEVLVTDEDRGEVNYLIFIEK